MNFIELRANKIDNGWVLQYTYKTDERPTQGVQTSGISFPDMASMCAWIVTTSAKSEA